MINPPLSDAEFKSHFLFGRDKIAEVLACLQFPKTAGRPANRDFAIRCDRHGYPIRWVGAETALLVFLKRLRTRGDAVIQLQSFFGRSEGWISLVFNAVVSSATRPTSGFAHGCFTRLSMLFPVPLRRSGIRTRHPTASRLSTTSGCSTCMLVA